MKIEKTIKTVYYCTECDQEYDEQDYENGDVCIKCTNHPDIEGCEDCMHTCDIEQEISPTYSNLKGCGKKFCEDCMSGTPFDAVYPSLLCNNCIKKHGIEEYYEESGRKIYDELKELRENSNNPEETEKYIESKYFPNIKYPSEEEEEY